MHYHLHLVPRAANTPELPMTRWDLKPGDMAAIKQTAEKIRGELE
jgi:diadenosine tetraphosphate (Ap4A) HIT family hydrolase